MKSESKKFEPKPVKKQWLISYEIYRFTVSATIKVDIGTRVIEAESLAKAYEALRMENHKVVITFIHEL